MSKKPIKIIIRSSFFLLLAFVAFAFYAYHKQHGEAIGVYNRPYSEYIQNGDLIFQTSTSSQSKAIQLATNSKYSHMGIIYEIEGQFFVYEAVQPVKLTPLKQWINRGKDAKYIIKRLTNADQVLTASTIAKMRELGKSYKGKSYDIYFEWSDDRIYCSELVWKIYKGATNIEIGQLEHLSDFDLSSDIVKAKMKERYGDNIPMDEEVISPAAMFNSDKLITIAEN